MPRERPTSTADPTDTAQRADRAPQQTISISGTHRASTDPQDFKHKDATYFAEGFRLHTIGGHSSNPLGVWRHGTGEQHWGIGITPDDFASHDSEYFKKGLRLIGLRVRHETQWDGPTIWFVLGI